MIQDKEKVQKALRGKILFTGNLQVITGLHIGGSSDFAPIGAVDSPFIRDPFTRTPIIPGSSLKGKMRTLLAKLKCKDYVLNDVSADNIIVKRLFGSSGKNFACPARLQFFDLFITKDTITNFDALETDTYIGEIKFENTINRITGGAKPRQIERVPAGAVFDFKLVYNVEDVDELHEDIKTLKQAFELLENDYLGGHGSRGYGRIKLQNITLKVIGDLDVNLAKLTDIFKD